MLAQCKQANRENKKSMHSTKTSGVAPDGGDGQNRSSSSFHAFPSSTPATGHGRGEAATAADIAAAGERVNVGDITGKQGLAGAGAAARALPLWAVNIKAAAALHQLPGEVAALVRAGGQFSLDEIGAAGLGNEVIQSVIQRLPVGVFKRGRRKGQTKFKVLSKIVRRVRRGGAAPLVGHVGDISAPLFENTRARDKWAPSPDYLPQATADYLAGQVGERLLNLAGGRGWCGGKVHLDGGGMTARAARSIIDGRRGRGGVIHWGTGRRESISSTSLREAAQCAAVAMFQAVRRWDRVTSAHWARLDGGRFVAWLAGIGWRAAFASFTDEARAGFHGRGAAHLAFAMRAGSVDSSGALEDCAALVELQAFRDWQRGGDKSAPRAFASSRYARRAAVRWIGLVLRVGRGGRGGQSARAAQCLLAWLLCGADWARAARAAGYASGAAAVESFRANQVWPQLRAAALARQSEGESLIASELRGALREYRTACQVRRAAASVRVMRYTPTGRRASSDGVRGALLTAAGAQRARRFARRGVASFNASRAIESKSAARARAVRLGARLAAARAARAAMWSEVTTGLRAGHLRCKAAV